MSCHRTRLALALLLLLLVACAAAKPDPKPKPPPKSQGQYHGRHQGRGLKYPRHWSLFPWPRPEHKRRL